MMTLPKLTFWRIIFVLILIAGAWAAVLRFTGGLAASTNLSDEFPWGLWIGFDILCGVMLAAGGFTLMATVNIFNAERYRSIVRPALLTAFLGYLLVCGALMFDLGKPWNIWHVIIMWNPHSVMFEVGWCVMLYTTVLFLEFLPVVFERFRLERPLRILHAISIPLVIFGVLLSTLHQSSLGTLYLIVAGKLHPLWYSPLLPVFFFVSALAVGIAMTMLEAALSARHLGHRFNVELMAGLSRILLVILAVYAVLRVQDLSASGAWATAMNFGYEAQFFWAEMLLGLAIPIVMLSFRALRTSQRGLFWIAISVVSGFIINRLNVATVGMEASSGVRYVPAWPEVAITASIVAVGIAAFGLAARYLPIFAHADVAHQGRDARAHQEPPLTRTPAAAGL
ncbi:MAG TPA: Ni/Fe-hydrogenase cytochrome b subunit [Thermoanaerobaculia bacterium]|nr:Ni/Fe-hydrogenase cytochrome b subunit [Thermoanaerobaculia bacterium]